MIRFWADSILGRPDAWSRLTPGEQGYVFARLEEKEGEHPLLVAPHHPPRAVVPESFPTARLETERLPKFTIVMPSFQQAAFLEPAILSVLDQKGVRLDLIVEDGGSTDGSADLLRKHSPRLKHWASGPDKGQADAIARGFEHMEAGTDDVMAFLNSDDLFMPGALRFVGEYFARHPSIDVVYGHRVLIDEDGREVGRWFAPRRSCDDLRFQDLIPQETLFWRKRIWDRVGGVDRSFQFSVDWDLLLRFTAAGARIARLPWFLGLFRLHPNQKSQARLVELGVPEMDRLRERSLGRVPLRAEIVARARRAQIDSTLLRRWMRRGWRI
jgi:glycosyltransferase involved in cell wall biosynthesis